MDQLPGHDVREVVGGDGLPLDPHRYRWVCQYWDALMAAPERFCVALWKDAAQAALDGGTECELLTYHVARLSEDGGVSLRRVHPDGTPREGEARTIDAAMIVNATGAWGDLTLSTLPVEAPRLFGGTRGSHIISRQSRLLDAIGDEAIYAEAPDGRLVFILPWGDAVLVGTTDERFEGPPEEAVADSSRDRLSDRDGQSGAAGGEAHAGRS